MIIKWKITAKCFNDSNNIQSTEIDAGSERKARINGKKKLEKKLKTSMIEVISCEKVLD